MSNDPFYDYLCDAVEYIDAPGTPAEDHQRLVNGLLKFLYEDMGYIVKHGDEGLLRAIADRLEDYL